MILHCLVLGVIASERQSYISFLLFSGHLRAYSLIVASFLCDANWMMCLASIPLLSRVVIMVALIKWLVYFFDNLAFSNKNGMNFISM